MLNTGVHEIFVKNNGVLVPGSPYKVLSSEFNPFKTSIKIAKKTWQFSKKFSYSQCNVAYQAIVAHPGIEYHGVLMGDGLETASPNYRNIFLVDGLPPGLFNY